MGKGAKKLICKAAEETTNGCTLTLFKRAAEHTMIQNRRRNSRRSNAAVPFFTAEQQHRQFVQHGHIPHFVESFVRGGHYRRSASG